MSPEVSPAAPGGHFCPRDPRHSSLGHTRLQPGHPQGVRGCLKGLQPELATKEQTQDRGLEPGVPTGPPRVCSSSSQQTRHDLAPRMAEATHKRPKELWKGSFQKEPDWTRRGSLGRVPSKGLEGPRCLCGLGPPRAQTSAPSRRPSGARAAEGVRCGPGVLPGIAGLGGLLGGRCGQRPAPPALPGFGVRSICRFAQREAG